MWNAAVVIIRDFAFACLFAAAFIFRRRLAQQHYESQQRTWGDSTHDNRELYARFVGGLALLALAVMFIATAVEIYRHAA